MKNIPLFVGGAIEFLLLFIEKRNSIGEGEDLSCHPTYPPPSMGRN
jgi:hypothetical protein